MNPLLATGPLAQALGWALLHLLWQAAAVAALLAVALHLLSGRSANLRYALSCGALLLVVALGVATGVRSYAAAPSTPSAVTVGHEPASGGVPSTGTLATDRSAVLAPAPLTWPARIDAVRRAASDALPFLVTLWLLGVATFSTRLVVEWFRTQRLVARSVVPAPEAWQAAARRLARALGVRRAVRLLESTAVVVPSVIGFVRPAILLPGSTLTGLTPAQLEMILAHELAHIRRHDFLVNLVQSAVETLLFYHPAVWWISRRVREERENCCDDLAVAVCGNPIQYARALTRLEELRADALPLAASANGGSLFERVRRIAGGPRRATGVAGRGVAALSALFCGMIALATLTVPAIGQLAPAARTKARTVTGTAVAPVAATRLTPAVSAFAAPSSEFAATADTEPSPVPVTEAGDALESLVLQEGTPAEPAVAEPSAEAEAEADTGTDAGDEDRPARKDGKPSLDELIALKVHGVTPQAIEAMRALFPNVSLKEIAGMHAVGATPDYVRAMRDAGIPVNGANDASGLAAVGVTPKYVREIRAAGLEVRTASQAQGLAAVGVTPEFLRDVRAAGLEVDHAEEAQSMAAVGVTGEYVKSLRAAGIPVKTAREASSLAAVGVSPEGVRRLRKAGVTIRTADEAQSLQAVGVTPEFVERLARAGYANLSVEELHRLAASGVTDDFIREMAKYRSR